MKKSIITLLLLGVSGILEADEMPFSYTTALFDQTDKNTLGLQYALGLETVTVFAPSDNTDHFSNGVVMTAFKGALYCMWQSSKTDEDAADTWVAYSRSTDGGKTWSAPMVIAADIDNGYVSSGGWHASDDLLVAYINVWPDNLSSPKGGYTRYVTSTDGIKWSEQADVMMADGTPIKGIFEQDPHMQPDGRIINGAHLQPGLKVSPIYTDDPNGISGWKKAEFTYTGKESDAQSRELEPSLYQKSDGKIVMIFRDPNSTYLKMAATSSDNGETWSNAVVTTFPDARTKQSAGNLPDGTAYFACNPVDNKLRSPLAIALSKDGNLFDTAYLLRSNGEMPTLRYTGKAKRAGYHYPKSMVHDGYLYVAYATNKEDVQYTRVPLSSISLNGSTSDMATVKTNNTTISFSRNTVHIQLPAETTISADIHTVSGQRVVQINTYGNEVSHNVSGLPAGTYIVRIKTAQGTVSKVILIR